MILACYRLARFYGQSPGHFLSMPLSAVQRHLTWTVRMLAETEQDADD